MRCGENLGSKGVVGSEGSVARGQVASASIATSENPTPQFSVLRCSLLLDNAPLTCSPVPTKSRFLTPLAAGLLKIRHSFVSWGFVGGASRYWREVGFLVFHFVPITKPPSDSGSVEAGHTWWPHYALRKWAGCR